MISICHCQNVNTGLIFLDQEKAFDNVDHSYLFEVLKGFGFGSFFISCIKLLYHNNSSLLNINNSLCSSFSVQRGIRQGCPLSGYLYSLFIEPLLIHLRHKLSGFSAVPSVKVLAYADDLCVIVNTQSDIAALTNAIQNFNLASSATVNWRKSRALCLGPSELFIPPPLPNALQWRHDGVKHLGVFLGNVTFSLKNWDQMVDQISHTLNCWKRLSSLLSYRGRVLIINNLAASNLWHRMIALQPPKSLILNLQRILVNCFWNGMHRLRADLLSVPLEKGGQGLVDITSKILSFRLTTLRQLLYKEVLSWRPLASCLLLQAGKLKCGLELVLLDLQRVDTSLLPSFYQSLLNASQCLLPVRNKDSYKFSNFMREPVFYNSLFHHDFQSRSLIQSFIESGFFLVEDFVNHTSSEWQTPYQILEACNEC